MIKILELDTDRVLLRVEGDHLAGVDLGYTCLAKASLACVDLSGADLRHADLSGACLAGAVLVAAYLENANLRGADLRSADLTNATINGASFRGALLSGARLHGATMMGFLHPTDFSGADLSGAVLSNSHIHKAVFRSARLDAADLRGLWCSEEIEWPEGFRPEALGAVTCRNFRRGVLPRESKSVLGLLRIALRLKEAQLLCAELVAEEEGIAGFVPPPIAADAVAAERGTYSRADARSTRAFQSLPDSPEHTDDAHRRRRVREVSHRIGAAISAVLDLMPH